MPFAKPTVTCDERPEAPRAAGIVFVAPDGDVLLLRRANTEPNFGGHWGLPGGKAEEGESAQDAAFREFKEECGLDIDMGTTLKLLDRVDTPTGMQFSTFAKPADDKFVPTLDAEHSGYCWASLDQLPRPLHPSVEKALSSHLGAVADMTPEDWKGLREGFAKWTREEEAEPEHDDRGARAQDARMAMDRQIYDELGRPGNDLLAFDAAPSVRSYDKDGRLRVMKANISKANVCPYWGREIPDFEKLGLDPDRKYQLLRHPAELAKAAKTSNGIPLLLGHTPVTPDRHNHDVVVGAIGTDYEFADPYLRNSLVVWTREGIDAVESEEAKELSSAYRYRMDPTPGTFKGVPYDGVMRDIEFNHVALVPEGRAGADVVVGDSQIKPGQTKEIIMSKKVLTRFGGASAVALSMHLLPKLAADAKLDLSPVFDGVTKANFATKKAQIAQDAKAAAKKAGLAQDANLDDVTQFLDKLEKVDVMEGADEDPNSGLPMNAAEMEQKAKDAAAEEEKKKAEDRKAMDRARDEFIKSKLSAEDMATYDAQFCAKDESEEAEENAEGKEGAGAAKPAKDSVTKGAMDAALKKQGEDIRRQMRETAEAYATVEPWVGKLKLGMDSAPEVYRTALKGLGMDAKEVDALHETALKPVLQAQPKPGEKNRTTFAQDGAFDGADNFQKRWGGTVDRLNA